MFPLLLLVCFPRSYSIVNKPLFGQRETCLFVTNRLKYSSSIVRLKRQSTFQTIAKQTKICLILKTVKNMMLRGLQTGPHGVHKDNITWIMLKVRMVYRKLTLYNFYLMEIVGTGQTMLRYILRYKIQGRSLSTQRYQSKSSLRLVQYLQIYARNLMYTHELLRVQMILMR